MRHSLIGLAVAASLGGACSSSTPAPTPDLAVPVTAHDMASGGGGGDMASSGGGDMAMPATNSASVAVMDNLFAPNHVTIMHGGTVTWTWSGSNPHTVTSGTGTPSGMFDSGSKMTGTFMFTFPNAGSFPYYCTVHGTVMSGTVTVQ